MHVVDQCHLGKPRYEHCTNYEVYDHSERGTIATTATTTQLNAHLTIRRRYHRPTGQGARQDGPNIKLYRFQAPLPRVTVGLQ